MKLDLPSQWLWFLVNVKVTGAAHILLLLTTHLGWCWLTLGILWVLCQNYQLTHKYRNFYCFVIFLYSQTHFGHILTAHSFASACNNYSFLHVGPWNFLFPPSLAISYVGQLIMVTQRLSLMSLLASEGSFRGSKSINEDHLPLSVKEEKYNLKHVYEVN